MQGYERHEVEESEIRHGQESQGPADGVLKAHHEQGQSGQDPRGNDQEKQALEIIPAQIPKPMPDFPAFLLDVP